MENTHPHAHPPSSLDNVHTRSRSITSLPLRDYPPKNSASTPKSVPHSKQQRLLHSRHARFSAQNLSFNGLTFPQVTRHGDVENSHVSSTRYTKQDDLTRNSDNSSDLTGPSPSSTILNEIAHFAASKHRSSHPRAPIPVFQDSPSARSPPPEQDIYSQIPDSTPDSIPGSRESMGLKELSVNVQRPSSKVGSSYYTSPRTSLRRRKSSHPKPRFNSEEYIQHIENELQLAKEALYSPKSHLAWSEKLKKAKEENEQLKKELDNTKRSFEYELRETVERLTANELGLKRKIRDLEEDIDHKQNIIHALEYEHHEKRLDMATLETLKARIEKLEEERISLELANNDMTKRNEVLTQLLALSPTKAHHSVDLPTPRTKSARPMSMIIPRVPSSPLDRTPLSRPQSVLISPSHQSTDYFARYASSSPLASSPDVQRPVNDPSNDDVQSLDSGLGESCANPPTNATSRRSTIASNVSSSPDLPSSRHAHGERPNPLLRQPSRRRARKFMPGSTQLKPLLLPAFTADSGNLPSASPLTSPSRPVSMLVSPTPHWQSVHSQMGADVAEDVVPSSSSSNIGAPGPSFQSLDEVFTKMGESLETHDSPQLPPTVHESSKSQSFDQVIDGVPPQRPEPRPRITSWVLKTMHECPEQDDIADSRQSAQPLRHILHESKSTKPYARHHSIQSSGSEISSVEIPRPLFSRDAPFPTCYDDWKDNLPIDPPRHIPRKRHKADSHSDLSFAGIEEEGSEPTPRPPLDRGPLEKGVGRVDKRSRPSSLVLRQGKPPIRGPLEMLQQGGIGAKPLAAITIHAVYATLSRYTSYIQGFKKDPLALARRIIANAWRSNWAMFGRMSWWVLGLFIGFRRPATRSEDFDWERYDGESIAYRYCSLNRDDGSLLQDNHDDCIRQAQHPQAQTSNPPPTAAEMAAKDPGPGWGKSVFLWGKFSVAIMLAIGGAIIKGPGEMLRDIDERARSRRNSTTGASLNSTSPMTSFRHFDQAYLVDEMPLSSHGIVMKNDQGSGVVRKVRSFSSPAPSSRYHDPDVVAQAPQKQTRVLPEPSSIEPEPIMEPAVQVLEESSTSFDTLRPRRAPRRKVDSFFEHWHGAGEGEL
ncbi:hypothetical protein PV10_00620 [Exophiala mesophila]|uniref:Uncharacterized protein n=1 Tax=Exophiala mesophila TaxID=212818 RepID=A0A0D2ACY7_EXOME|nr:uncharacterized protein PV10_00620 [Exophiala mesophila]KIV96803.1 hypothetical protein PV10_00620 [Exophiala mesophila]